MRLHDGRVVPTFLRQAILGEDLTIFGDGMQTRSVCYVADLVEGIYRLMLSHTNEPVNIGNPGEMTILEFAHLIKKIAGSTSEIVFKELPVDDPKVRQPDIQRAEASSDGNLKFRLKKD
jgi:dTDP-glucose 4,6-dehydratase